VYFGMSAHYSPRRRPARSVVYVALRIHQPRKDSRSARLQASSVNIPESVVESPKQTRPVLSHHANQHQKSLDRVFSSAISNRPNC
jgi:hypothetical protein